MQIEEPLITVLIVDDELPLRQQMRSYDWTAMGVVVIGEAEDGEEALQFCKEHRPDVVFTDITMPIMDGMSFLQQLRKEQIPIQAILLTCHSDFHFAQTGIQLGVIDYLIKISMTENELQHAVSKARQQLNLERTVSLTAIETKQWGQMLHIHKLFEQARPHTEIHDALLATGLPIHAKCRMAGIHLDCYYKDRQFLAREIQLILNRSGAQFSWFPLQNEYLILFHDLSLTPEQLSIQLRKKVEELYQELERTFSFIGKEYRIVGWLGEKYESGEAYCKDLMRVVQKKDHFFYMPESEQVIQLSLSQVDPQRNEYQLFEELERNRQRVGASKQDFLAFAKNEFAAWCRDKQPSEEALKSYVVQSVQRIQRYAQIDTKTRHQNSVMNAFTIGQLIAAIVHQLSEENERDTKWRPEVRQTLDIIQKRISEPITLQSIAEEVGLRSHYLGKLFKEGVGESFNEYVSKLRIEKATQLLSTTNLKVYEVAEQVGITSYRYFTILFRQFTGQTPSEFKRE